MRKEDMIRQILRSLESDFFKISRRELDQELMDAWRRLDEQTYTEVEELYYATA